MAQNYCYLVRADFHFKKNGLQKLEIFKKCKTNIK